MKEGDLVYCYKDGGVSHENPDKGAVTFKYGKVTGGQGRNITVCYTIDRGITWEEVKCSSANWIAIEHPFKKVSDFCVIYEFFHLI